MNICNEILLILSILITSFTCNIISEDQEEYKLNSPDEDLELDVNSTKKAWKSERSYEKETANDKEISEPEYFSQRLKSPYSQLDLSEVESQPNYEAKSDLVTEEIGTTTNIKHQSRSLKSFKNESIEHESSYSETRETDSSYKKPEDFNNLDFENGLKTLEKFKYERNLHDSIADLNRNLSFFKKPETNKENIPDPFFPSGKEDYRILFEMNIHPLHLIQPLSPHIMQSLHIIYKELITLIELDIQSNILPLVFYQTVSPVIKKKLLPLLELPTLKKKIARLERKRKFPGLFDLLKDIIDIPEDLKYDDYTISNIFRLLDKDFKGRKIDDNDKNKKLAKLYKKIVKRIQKLLDQDWLENESPVNFIKYLSVYLNKINLYIVGRLYTEVVTQKYKRGEPLSEKSKEIARESLESLGKDEL